METLRRDTLMSWEGRLKNLAWSNPVPYVPGCCLKTRAVQQVTELALLQDWSYGDSMYICAPGVKLFRMFMMF